MAGSTGGGVKTLRTLIAFRSLRMSFRSFRYRVQKLDPDGSEGADERRDSDDET